METNIKIRRSRHHRDIANPPRIRLAERDIEIFRYVYQHRLLTTSQIMLLVDGISCLKDDQHFYNRLKTFQRRLAGLWQNSFLYRDELPVYKGYGSGEKYYSLDANGVDMLSEHSAIDPQIIKWNQKHNQVGDRYVRHALMTSDFLVCVQAACQHPNHQGISYVDMGSGRDLHHSFSVEQDSKTAMLHFKPDHMFALEDGRSDSKKCYHFCLESDRSTMDHNRMRKKFLGYWFYRSQNFHAEKLGVGDFRVLTLCRSEARRQALRQLVNHLNIPAEDKKNLFWFSTTREVRLNEPEAILGPIWQAGSADSGKTELSENDKSWALVRAR